MDKVLLHYIFTTYVTLLITLQVPTPYMVKHTQLAVADELFENLLAAVDELSVFDHIVGLVLKGLRGVTCTTTHHEKSKYRYYRVPLYTAASNVYFNPPETTLHKYFILGKKNALLG